MDLVKLAQDATEIIKQAQPVLLTAVETGKVLGTLGSTVVTLVQKGREIVALFIRQETPAAPAGDAGSAPPRTQKKHVAILVEINQKIMPAVAGYLQEQGIDADLILISNNPTVPDKVKFLSEDAAEWRALVQEFASAMNGIRSAVGNAQVHIFLATPLPLAFGLGSVWGTVNEATVYHWNGKAYFPAMQISRDLRQ